MKKQEKVEGKVLDALNLFHNVNVGLTIHGITTKLLIRQYRKELPTSSHFRFYTFTLITRKELPTSSSFRLECIQNTPDSTHHLVHFCREAGQAICRSTIRGYCCYTWNMMICFLGKMRICI
jgi:hypothetical protein